MSATAIEATRHKLAGLNRGRATGVVDIARRLIEVPSPTPPGDTNAVADALMAVATGHPSVEAELHRTAPHLSNVVVRVRGGRPGPRLILNGHLDTFPLGDPAQWTADPRGEVRDGRLYGLGVCDMKGGVAASLQALLTLARCTDAWAGELVGTFAGDEETMGLLGSQALLDSVPHARGNAMICADAGSARVLRFGEKGFVWLTITAQGRSAHAAHVHRGDSAIDRLIGVMSRFAVLRDLPVRAPAAVEAAIAAAASVSEVLSGAGETAVLRGVTVTFGTIAGGRLRNLVADRAEATADIRIPVGVAVEDVLTALRDIEAGTDGVRIAVDRSFEPTWTDPDQAVIGHLRAAAAAVLGYAPALTMRVGASDCRLYRRAGIPSVVCGVTPNNMGAADEYVEVEELDAVAEILTLAAFEFLQPEAQPGV